MAEVKLSLKSAYAIYIKSPAWRAFRDRYRSSEMPQFCLSCYSRRFGLHHINYDRLGVERLTDVVPLCWQCHKKLHLRCRGAGNTGIKGFKRQLNRVLFLDWSHIETRMAAWSACKGEGRNQKKYKRQLAKTRGMIKAMRRDREFHERMCGN